MQKTRAGKMEYEIEAEFLHEFYRKGLRKRQLIPALLRVAYACVAFQRNNCVLKDGDLLLIDAGCELDGCLRDITHAFPVNGKFRLYL